MRRTITGNIALRIVALAVVATGNCVCSNSAVWADEPIPTVRLDAPRWAMLPQDELNQPATESAQAAPTLSGDSDETLRDALEMLAEENGNASDDVKLGDNSPSVGNSDGNESLFAGRVTQFTEGRFALPPIEALTTETAKIGNGETPDGFRQGAEAAPVALPESGAERASTWYWSQRYWAAANTFSHPLYFEDRMLERHGQSRFPHMQPLVSAGRFAGQFAMLPYQVAISPPYECQYTLGYYRAGSCVPAFLQRPPYNRKAAVAQAVSMATLTALP
ncbi:hypothetical protein [Rhodopirellula sp. MGV]|uniref:hypothetical protein n=1 Tax=Rhodopirellula sp. MGV TaxID=2023130 RepID=UPI000BD1F565|nr:hypothetical protein [Rhodopirellula sp. MGV]OYP33123.1 hypothetical protein CGZ80_18025 [Rhodopirellula sp. MGV]